LHHSLSDNRSIVNLCSERYEKVRVGEGKARDMLSRRSRGLKEVLPVLRLHNSNSGAAVVWKARGCDAHFATSSQVVRCS
jgi:hypothetical protein